MKLSLALAAWAALASASLLAGHKPPGLLKGTFHPDIAARVAAENAGAHKLNKRTAAPDGSGAVPTNGWGTFQQLIDHNNPRLGTFSQRYWYSTTYWKGPGSPVVMTNPGEQSGTGWNVTYLTNQRIPGLFADKVGAAILILEHRYWGESSPYAELTVKNLQYLTLDNTLRDMAYFAETFVPPFDPSGRSRPSKVPWIVTGGSYPGAIAAWLASVNTNGSHGSHGSYGSHGSPFWAHYATSGVVQAVGDFWEYFAIAQANTPQNCSRDLTATIAHIDDVLLCGTGAAKADLKTKFRLGDLADADFARALALGPLYFQETQFFFEQYFGYAPYNRFCDYIENAQPGSNTTAPGSGGVGVAKALDGYARWFDEMILPHMCESYGLADFKGTYNTGCLKALNASNVMYLDLSPTNAIDRQYWWITCNEPFVWFQDALPAGQPSIVSRLVNYDYHVAVCKAQFPESAGGFGLLHGRTPAQVNAYTGGWSVPPHKTPRLLYSNGEIDPWRAATVSSDWRPGGRMASTDEVIVNIVPKGGHCSDAYAENWAVNPEVKAFAEAEAEIISGWVDDFYRIKGLTKPT